VGNSVDVVGGDSRSNPLRVDWLGVADLSVTGRLGRTFLPGKNHDGLSGLKHARSARLDAQRLRDKYRVERVLGEGGMGKVYRGRNLRTEHSIAIKTLMPELVHDESLVRRFEVEAKAASNLSHPNTIRVYDHGNEGKLLWMVMELLDGISLERALNIERAIEPRRLIGLMRQVCASLAEAHGKGLVHRDLKPDNIFLNRAGGEADFVKVLDFGVAKLKDPKFGSEKLTQAGMIFGTPRYMSPEQARAKELDERSDIYALGVIMFECLTGKAPFEAADPIGVLVKHCNEPVPTFASVNPSLAIDPGFEEIVRRCLAKKPEQRPATVKELRAELDALDVRLASGQPAPDNATRHLDLGASPEDTARDQNAPDTFDRLGITQQSGRQPANPSCRKAAHALSYLGNRIFRCTTLFVTSSN
jgi:serine/threonine-protein kinase